MTFTRGGGLPAGHRRISSQRGSRGLHRRRARHRWLAPRNCARPAIAVTIFDNRPLPGGLNTYGVAEYKLRAADSLREVELIRSLGVEFRQAEVGPAVRLEAIGAGVRVRLSWVSAWAPWSGSEFPARDAAGVIDALRFIERYKTAQRFPCRPSRRGDRRRQYRHRRSQCRAASGRRDRPRLLPAHAKTKCRPSPFEYEHSKVEGVEFHWLAQPVEIVARRSRSRVNSCTRSSAAERDRPRNAIVRGSEFEFPCDMVIPALGQSRIANLLRHDAASN